LASADLRIFTFILPLKPLLKIATHLYSSRAHTVLDAHLRWVPSKEIPEGWGRLGRGLPLCRSNHHL
jgi:hypothetical protein